MELSSPEYSARDAHERHVGGRPETMDTVGVSMDEIARLNLRAKPDPLPDNRTIGCWCCPRASAKAAFKTHSRPSPSLAAGSTPHLARHHCGSRSQLASPDFSQNCTQGQAFFKGFLRVLNGLAKGPDETKKFQASNFVFRSSLPTIGEIWNDVGDDLRSATQDYAADPNRAPQ